jgi:hypothetical protein
MTIEFELSFMLRPTVSRPVSLGIKHPFGAYDQIFVTCVTVTMTIEGLLEAVFSVGSAPRLYNEDTSRAAVNCQLSEVT